MSALTAGQCTRALESPGEAGREAQVTLTALGFAAAGIAFALQTIILALAGYFAIVAPKGIRVGDRVSLQGPFSYVQGEVVEISFLRITPAPSSRSRSRRSGEMCASRSIVDRRPGKIFQGFRALGAASYAVE